MAVAGVRRGAGAPLLAYLARDGRDNSLSLDEQLNALTSDIDTGGRRAVIALPHTAYQLLQIEAPDVDPAELRAAVRWRIKDLIDYHVEDAVVDVIDVPQLEGRSGNHAMYALSAMPASRVLLAPSMATGPIRPPRGVSNGRWPTRWRTPPATPTPMPPATAGTSTGPASPSTATASPCNVPPTSSVIPPIGRYTG